MGLARAEGSVRLPDALRDVLLNYPGQRPLFDIHVRMNLSRELDIHVIGTDYRGRVVVPEARTSSMLVFAGFSAWAVFGSALDALRWSVTLGELSLKVPGDDWVASSLDKLGFSGHLLRDEPGWRGSVKASLGGWTVESAEVHLRLGEISLGAELGIRHTEGGQKNQAVTLDGSVAPSLLRLTGGNLGEIGIGRMRLTGDWLREWRTLWTGHTAFAFEGLSMAGEGYRTELASLTASSNTVSRNGAVDQTFEFDFGTLSVNGLELGKG